MPSPHPVGLQSCCSTPQGSLPLRLYWITPPHWNNALPQPGSLPLRLCQALAPPGPPPLGTCQIHALLGPQSLGPCQIHTPSGLPPLKSPPLRLCWTQLHMGQPDPHPTWIHASWAMLDPCPDRITAPQGQAPAWHETTASPSPLGSLPLVQSQAPVQQALQINTPTSSCSGYHYRAPNMPKRHTDRTRC
jgi:hypothetical protein